jgi:septum formation protein
MLYLASQSPRRRELLQQIQIHFKTVLVEVDETPLAEEHPANYVQRVALAKAQAGLAQFNTADDWILGADTIVVQGHTLFGKPRDLSDAYDILSQLSGCAHQVMTAVALVNQHQVNTRLSTSTVHLRPLTATEIERYVATGEPADKAGGYAIQGLAAQFVKHLTGSYSGVMGLPLYETAELLTQAGLNRLSGHAS